ncbi:ester cyclase [Natronosalvus vescus]|uniref:ester cyclase n=1 Tax=Natronosalvus vescus TaxID=2953881 RepID=UPI0020901541|nr:ester cyclase [Natronosalvus vescus]
MFHAAFSDLEATEGIQFSDESGEYVCSAYTYRGTHDGDFMGIPPTDTEAEIQGLVINRIEDGRIAEAWVLADFLGLLQQVGVVPSMEDVATGR